MFGIKGSENHSSKRIIDLTTGVIYDSVTLAAKELNLESSAITKIAACARGKKPSAYQRVFRYVDENDNPIYVDIECNTKIITPILDINTNRIYNTE